MGHIGDKIVIMCIKTVWKLEFKECGVGDKLRRSYMQQYVVFSCMYTPYHSGFGLVRNVEFHEHQRRELFPRELPDDTMGGLNQWQQLIQCSENLHGWYYTRKIQGPINSNFDVESFIQGNIALRALSSNQIKHNCVNMMMATCTENKWRTGQWHTISLRPFPTTHFISHHLLG